MTQIEIKGCRRRDTMTGANTMKYRFSADVSICEEVPESGQKIFLNF